MSSAGSGSSAVSQLAAQRFERVSSELDRARGKKDSRIPVLNDNSGSEHCGAPRDS